jgi:biopolymer transport protein ExbD
MAEIIQNEGGGKKKGKRRAKKHSTHIDMTPMVDLACLLVTFFMLTTAFSKPKVMELVLPDKKDKTNPPKVDDSRTVNIILDGDNKVYYYNGMAKPNDIPELIGTNFGKDGLRKILLNRNKDLFSKIKQLNADVVSGKLSISRDSVNATIKLLKKEDKLGPVVLIKATEKVKYGNIVDVVDEMAIADINRYAIVDLTPLEKKMLEAAKTQQPK